MNESKRLERIFKIENLDELRIERIERGIECYKLINEIVLTSNSCLYFIDELNDEKTEFYKELIKIKYEISKFYTLI